MIRALKTDSLFFIIIFIVFFVFYTQIHPLVPYDTDDWLNLVTSRGFYPSLNQWNPTKVFPECLEALVGTFAAFVLSPLLGDYLNALVIANAATLSFFITSYLFLSHRLLIHRFNLGKISSFCIIILFALLHFVILRVADENNEYLWYSHSCNCTYHYTISSLFASCLVLWLIDHKDNIFRNNLSNLFLFFVTYLVLLSNLFSSVILIAYSGAVLIIDLIETFQKKIFSFRSYSKQNKYYIIVILAWLVVQLIEVCGERANDYGNLHSPFFEGVYATIKNVIRIHKNHVFLYFSLTIFFVAKLHNWRVLHQKIFHIGKTQIIIILAFFLSLTYQILLVSRVHPHYIKQSDVIVAFAVFFMFLLLISLGYLCSNIKYFRVILPFLIFFAFFESNTKYNTFKGVQSDFSINGHACLEQDRDFIQQVIDADKLGQDTVWINVPQYRLQDYNWPLMTTDSQFFGETLYKHNITSRKIVTIYVPSKNYSPKTKL